jgi:hypothetical protein
LVLRFLRQVDKACPRRYLHVVCDNYGSHKYPRCKGPGWPSTRVLQDHHWQAIRRGTFTASPTSRPGSDLHRRLKPALPTFTWTKHADVNVRQGQPTEEPQDTHELRNTPLGVVDHNDALRGRVGSAYGLVTNRREGS